MMPLMAAPGAKFFKWGIYPSAAHQAEMGIKIVSASRLELDPFGPIASTLVSERCGATSEGWGVTNSEPKPSYRYAAPFIRDEARSLH